MAYFVITCLDKAASLELRMETREVHLAYLESQKDILRLAGPFLDAGGSPIGSMLIVEAADQAEAEKFAANDPYAKAGLFESNTVHPWRKVIGDLS